MFFLLPSDELVPVINRVISDYYVTAVLIAMLIFLLWRIWRYLKLYAEFPTFPILRYAVYSIVMNKIPKHLPFAAFIFQKLIRLGQRFQKEKLYLVWMREPLLIILNGDIVKAIDSDIVEKTDNYTLLKVVLGNGLLTSNADTWRVHRKLLNPVFHVGMLKKKIPIFNDNANTLVKKLEAETRSGTPVDVSEHIKTCALNVLCEYLLGLDMNMAEYKDQVQSYLEAIAIGSDLIVNVIGQPWLQFEFMWKIFPSTRHYEKLRNTILMFPKKILSAMRKEICSRKTDKEIEDGDWKDDQEVQKSFAHIMLHHHLKDNSFTMDDIESQISTFMIAGFDTVAHAVLWVLFMLGHHPDVQDQAYNEIDALSELSIKYEDLHQLKYLECVIKETLRMYPVIPVYSRKLNKDQKCGKYTIPKGTGLVFFPYTLHRNPEVYPDPEKFDPDRFQEGNTAIRPENYIPFGKGVRNCIGKTFAMIEMKVILAYILRNFKITSLEKREDVDLTWNILLVPVRPLRFRFTPRD